ncbi:MAG TPA: HAMP domain-containing protein, partial [Dongiaceae bacterium]|nr:HAMP domain-containing protein [Dongiaceae bacterium]
MFDASFRTKVLAPVIIVMALLVAVTVFVVNYLVTEQFFAEAKDNLATANNYFLNSQQLHQRVLKLRFGNLPNEPRYRSVFQLGDAPTLHKSFVDFLSENENGVDVVFYSTNETGFVASETRNPAISATAVQSAAASAIKRALQGQQTVGTVRVGEQLFDVVSIPVDVDGNVIGALTIGSEIGNADAQEFGQLAHAQIALLAGGHVVASTLSSPDVNGQFVSLFKSFSSVDPPSSAQPIILDDKHYFGMAGRFESLNGDNSLGYVLLSSYEDSQLALQKTKQLLLEVSYCAILFGAAVIWFLINRVTRPLRELRDSTEAVGRGDFSRHVPVRSKDEFGKLAVAFNQMTENVQQSRAQLEKTVETLKGTQEQLIQSEKLSAV